MLKIQFKDRINVSDKSKGIYSHKVSMSLGNKYCD